MSPPEEGCVGEEGGPKPILRPPVPEPLPSDAPIGDVTPIHWPGGVDLGRDGVEIERYVEQPLVAACRLLRDKRVSTTLSSANRENLRVGSVDLYVDFDNLTEANRRVACRVGTLRFGQDMSDGWRCLCCITIPIDTDSTVASVSERAIEIAEQFEAQGRRHPYPVPLAEARLLLGYASGSFQEYSLEELASSGLFDYDPKTKTIHLKD